VNEEKAINGSFLGLSQRIYVKFSTIVLSKARNLNY